jgi:hypothetical protein
LDMLLHLKHDIGKKVTIKMECNFNTISLHCVFTTGHKGQLPLFQY